MITQILGICLMSPLSLRCTIVSIMIIELAASDFGGLQTSAATRDQLSGQKRKLPGNRGQGDP